jgi:murein DD-endopeptidase MepM/ murein hydrolase activator NlpD
MSDFRKQAEQDTELNTLLQELLGTSAPGETAATPAASQPAPIVNYQLPIRVGKSGRAIEDGDQPWVVGTFAPNQYLNDTHPQGHMGVDLKAPQGTPVYPIGPGVVIDISSNPKGGQAIKVSHEDGHVVSYYAHLSQISVTKGQNVTLETVIGAVGDTGNAKGRGAHLHYEVAVDNHKIDPATVTNKPVGSLSRQKKAEIYSDILKILRAISV